MLKVVGLTKFYEGRAVVQNINFELKPGTIVGLIGPNGAGKTTTLLSLVGLVQPSSGSIICNSYELDKDRERYLSSLGFVTEDIPLYDYLTGFEYLRFIGEIWRIPKANIVARIQELGEELDMIDHLHRFIHSYSKGMKQKISLMAALLHEPSILLLDEPLTGLDPESSRKMKAYFREYVKKGRTILFSSHILEVVEKLCDNILLLKDGKIVASGPLEDILQGRNDLEDVFASLALKGGDIHV